MTHICRQRRLGPLSSFFLVPNERLDSDPPAVTTVPLATSADCGVLLSGNFIFFFPFPRSQSKWSLKSHQSKTSPSSRPTDDTRSKYSFFFLSFFFPSCSNVGYKGRWNEEHSLRCCAREGIFFFLFPFPPFAFHDGRANPFPFFSRATGRSDPRASALSPLFLSPFPFLSVIDSWVW